MGLNSYGRINGNSWIYCYTQKESSCLKSKDITIYILKGSFGSLFCLVCIVTTPITLNPSLVTAQHSEAGKDSFFSVFASNDFEHARNRSLLADCK